MSKKLSTACKHTSYTPKQNYLKNEPHPDTLVFTLTPDLHPHVLILIPSPSYPHPYLHTLIPTILIHRLSTFLFFDQIQVYR
jgi:hypothetical protein